VWRWQDGRLTVHRLRTDGGYDVVARSACFPSLTVAELPGWVERARTMDETSLVRAFRAWVRDQPSSS
jgi:hypothetical protein